MEGVHARLSEAVLFVVDGEIEFNVAGESVTRKKEDAMLKPYNAIVGTKTISTTQAELLVVSCPDELLKKLKSTWKSNIKGRISEPAGPGPDGGTGNAAGGK